MKRLMMLVTAAMFLSVGCENNEPIGQVVTALTAEEKRTYARPDIRHKNYEPDVNLSGTKLIEPERLNNIILNLLSQNSQKKLDPNPIDPTFASMGSIDHNRYPRYLGGLDYNPITRRTTEVTATMPLVIDRLAMSVCETLDLNPSDADELHRQLCSRPIDAKTQTNVTNILATDPGIENPWKAVCIYFLLKEGSFLMN